MATTLQDATLNATIYTIYMKSVRFALISKGWEVLMGS